MQLSLSHLLAGAVVAASVVEASNSHSFIRRAERVHKPKEAAAAAPNTAAAAPTATTTAAAGAAQAPYTIPANPSAFSYGTPSNTAPGVISKNRNGPTNPKGPKLGTPVNQTSVARLASINSIDDWCTFGPYDLANPQPMGNIEDRTVAWCTKARNNARVIPDGTLTAVHFVKTPLYVQIMALGDFTKIGMVPGDMGGELDPHGATNMGNPVGGNVTSNVVDGKTDVFYEEWMNYLSANQVCFRVCIAASSQVTSAAECQHTLDEMGCNFVMPGNYADNSFDSCDGDAAYPPGLYPLPGGGTSSFQQYATGVYSVDGVATSYTNASPDQTTPSAAYSQPATSNCRPTSSISNGIQAIVTAPASSSSSTIGRNGGGSGSGSGSSAGQAGSSSSLKSGADSLLSQISSGYIVSAAAGFVGLVAGAIVL